MFVVSAYSIFDGHGWVEILTVWKLHGSVCAYSRKLHGPACAYSLFEEESANARVERAAGLWFCRLVMAGRAAELVLIVDLQVCQS